MQTAWNTLLIPKSRRADFWRGAVYEAFLAMTPRIGRVDDFVARLDHLTLGASSLNRVVAPAHGVMRTASDIGRDDRQYFFFNLGVSGRCQVVQAGRDYTAPAGELVLIDSRIPYRIELPDGGTLLSLAVPSDWLPMAANHTARALPDSPANWMLRHHMHALTRMPDFAPGQDSALEPFLIAMLCAAISPDAGGHKPHVTRLDRLRQLVQRHASDPEFSPARAAALANLSVRSLHAAFARAGTTFGHELMEHRMQWARQRLLTGPGEARMADIAAAAGFKSLEHFSRRFRTRFGMAPSVFRQTRGR